MNVRSAAAGFSAVEIVFVAALTTTLAGVTVPPVLRTLDDFRAVGAARYLASRLQRARMEAIRRSANVAVHFTTDSEFATYVDGNANGVLATDVRSGMDWQLGAVERLGAAFQGVIFGTIDGLPPVESSGSPPGSEPIHLGPSNSASFSPMGTSSSGSVYLRSRTRQLVVRIYGDTGKTRILQFDEHNRQWRSCDR
jgi:hypothetical protein